MSVWDWRFLQDFLMFRFRAAGGRLAASAQRLIIDIYWGYWLMRVTPLHFRCDDYFAAWFSRQIYSPQLSWIFPDRYFVFILIIMGLFSFLSHFQELAPLPWMRLDFPRARFRWARHYFLCLACRFSTATAEQFTMQSAVIFTYY